MPHVTALYTYPLKSCGRLQHNEIALGDRGLVYDRHWMWVSDTPDERGLYLTQRDFPRMALIQPRLEAETLIISTPDTEAIRLPIAQERRATRTVLIWNDECQAVDMGDEAAAWGSAMLDYPARLVAMADGFARPVSTKFTDRPSQTGFADGYPLLILSEASVADLNARLTAGGKRAIEISRFRPNVVVGDCDAYAEDGWRDVTIGDVPFEICKPCARCAITTVDQSVGAVPEPREPLATLATYRRGASGGVLFGQNMIHRGGGALKVGDAVTILERAAG